MKRKESDLVIGQEYWFDGVRDNKGVFVGVFSDTLCFYPIGECGYPGFNPDGTVPFPINGHTYEEVE